MIALQVKKFPIYDVFTGPGWESWTRILLDKSKKAVVLSGQQLPRHVLTLLEVEAPKLATAARERQQKVVKK